MLITIANKILEKYPDVEIGYLVAQVLFKKSDPFVEHLKEGLLNHLIKRGVNATNFAVSPNISLWRNIYENDFKVKAKTYRCSLEALTRRVITGKEIWNICNIVDLYNCCSILSLLPMGGYDLKKVSGDITIRYAKEGEPFWGLGEREKITATSNHVIYADDQKILCWLWNHKDSKGSCIDETSTSVIFFIDSFNRSNVQSALNILEENLEKIQCSTLKKGILNKNFPQVHLKTMTIPCFENL